MKTRLQDCDHRRIDAFLDSAHLGLEDELLLEHLNTCAGCRDYMETQAADLESWSNAGQLLQSGEFDHASTHVSMSNVVDWSAFRVRVRN